MYSNNRAKQLAIGSSTAQGYNNAQLDYVANKLNRITALQIIVELAKVAA